MNIEQLLSKHSNTYRFHGVRSATLQELLSQSEDGAIALWGTDHDEHIDNEDGEFDTEYTQGAGFLYVTSFRNVEMSFNEFCDEDGIVFVLEPIVTEPFEFDHPSDRRQSIIKAEDWNVIGGLRPVLDEDGDLIEMEAFSLEEIAEM